MNLKDLLPDWNSIVISTIVLVGAIGIGVIIHRLVFAILRRGGARHGTIIESSLARHCYRPALLLIPAATVDMVLAATRLSATGVVLLGHLDGLILIGAVAWLVTSLTAVVTDALLTKYRIEDPDNLRARKIQTQLQVFRRTIAFIVILLAAGTMLTTFSWARALGSSLLASAGIAGLVAGIAARPTIANLVASIQIALTEPISLEDVVIVEGEWGWIEEILTTYVVVRTWDLRRLIVPISYFVEKPFQNWTRTTAEIIGAVFIYVDYTCPIEPLRDELQRILRASSRWNRKVCALQVTNASERSIELRALMSAANSGLAFDLRCEVREQLIDFIKRNYPDSLPKSRAEVAEFRSQIAAGESDSRARGQNEHG
jgi:small-conductance mechanosensitive channel